MIGLPPFPGAADTDELVVEALDYFGARLQADQIDEHDAVAYRLAMIAAGYRAEIRALRARIAVAELERSIS